MDASRVFKVFCIVYLSWIPLSVMSNGDFIVIIITLSAGAEC